MVRSIFQRPWRPSRRILDAAALRARQDLSRIAIGGGDRSCSPCRRGSCPVFGGAGRRRRTVGWIRLCLAAWCCRGCWPRKHPRPKGLRLARHPFRPHAGRAEDRRRASQFACRTGLVQHRAMDRAEETVLGPLGESPVRGLDVTRTSTQLPAGTAAGQQVHDCGEPTACPAVRSHHAVVGDRIRAHGFGDLPEHVSATRRRHNSFTTDR